MKQYPASAFDLWVEVLPVMELEDEIHQRRPNLKIEDADEVFDRVFMLTNDREEAHLAAMKFMNNQGT